MNEKIIEINLDDSNLVLLMRGGVVTYIENGVEVKLRNKKNLHEVTNAPDPLIRCEICGLTR